MTRGYARLIPVVLLITAGAAAVWYYTRPKPIEVRVRPVERGTVERTVANTRAGTVKACRRAKLSPSMGGQISRLPIKEGDRVKADELLLELWNKDLSAEVKLAESETQSAQARAKAACLQAQEARRKAERLLRLRKIGAASEEAMDNAVTQAESLSADCEAAQASVLTSQARLGVTKAQLERTRLTAPFDGVVAEINGEVNEFLTPSPPGIPTPPAVDLIDNSCFYVSAPIDEVDAPEIVPGMPARITLDAYGDRSFDGRVRRVAPYVLDREKQARTVDVEVAFQSPDDIRGLLAGYSADVEIILEVRRDTLRLPTEAVLDGRRVFVFLPEAGVIKERLFKKGLSNWNHTEVLSGLSQGEQVVVNVDQAGLKDGAHAVAAAGRP